ncbi:hypothetical protein FQN57_006741 [Myotisia sp. PD_48]|nr:hypothetical protein FQN57_006741 [Myotisia sp. PD_48]
MSLQWTAILLLSGVLAHSINHLVKLETKRDLDSSLANIHLTYAPNDGSLDFITYGPCRSTNPQDQYHTVTHLKENRPERVIWVVPQDAQQHGCLSAWNKNRQLLGRSDPLTFQRKAHRRQTLHGRDHQSIPMTFEHGIDTQGPWFDGVMSLNKNRNTINAKDMKRKKVAIVGGGMAGLMTYLNLKTSGFENLEIIEASNRIGGRVRTEYLTDDPFDYQYVEMGAMRFPKNIINATSKESLPMNDQKIVFQLADTLNRLNKNNKKHKINFIPFIVSNPNALYYYNGIRNEDGTVPTNSDVGRNASLKIPPFIDPGLDEARNKFNEFKRNATFIKEMSENIFKAHKQFLSSGLGGEEGGDDFSEWGFMHNYLKLALNHTESLLNPVTTNFFVDIFESIMFGNPDILPDYVTIDGGLSQLPNAFLPLLRNDLKTGRDVQKIDYLDNGDASHGKVRLTWSKNKGKSTESETYDYVIIAAPFTAVRRWRLPVFHPMITRAINRLKYIDACKVALQFKTRFWEKGNNPIYGGTSSTDIPGFGSIVYPSYDMNATGPGVLLASYSITEAAAMMFTFSDEEHVDYVLNAIGEIHGEEAKKQYSGSSRRLCWPLDPKAGGGWADAGPGQHKLLIPYYFQTEKHIIFVGEHTSFTHSWVASALESGIRGSVQLLLELGLVDEAKDVTKQWMARWISV